MRTRRRPAPGPPTMQRRAFARWLGAALAAPVLAYAKTEPKRPSRLRRIGILNVLPREAQLPQTFLRELQEKGYVDRVSAIVEYRSGPYDDFPRLAKDLVDAQVDVIYAVLEQAALAARNATATIPIVFAVIGDPVRLGLVASLARPGGNATGVTAYGSGLGGKRLELLKELIPGLSRVGFIWSPPVIAGASGAASPGEGATRAELGTTEAGARALGVEVRSFPVRSAADIGAAFKTAKGESFGALIVEENSLTYAERRRIAELAMAERLPAIYGFRDYVVAGGLMSYGANLPELMLTAVDYIDRVLKGANPGGLPVSQPKRFELVLNANAAKSLGLRIPEPMLARADELIQ